QRALLLQAKQGAFVLGTRAIPKPGQGRLLIKVEAASLNPIDWRIQETGLFIEDYPAVLGYGTAGVVAEVGEGVTKFAVGDRVAAPGIVGNSDYCSFQQYSLGDARFTAKIPSNVSFDEAASLGVSLDTPAIGLFGPHNAKLTSPIDKPGVYKGQSIVILGGSATISQFAIQLSRLAGFSNIIAVASPVHEPLLKSLGATHVVDRRSPSADIIASIKSIADSDIKVVYDGICGDDTQAVGWGVLSQGGHMAVSKGTIKAPEGDEETRTVGFTFGSPHIPPHYEFGEKLWGSVHDWLQNGTIVPNKVEVLPGGLGGIVAGLERLEAGKVSGVKLVVRPQE
ncbi:GroES-like protein, partial [Coniophora puteana RWD-64-598 SS2]